MLHLPTRRAEEKTQGSLHRKNLPCYISAMARDPKNFTGEDVPALLAEYDRHKRAKDDAKGFGTVLIGILCGAGLLFIIISAVAGLFR